MFFSGNLAHGLGYLGIPRKFFKLGSGPAVAITRFVIHSFGIEGFIHGSCLSVFKLLNTNRIAASPSWPSRFHLARRLLLCTPFNRTSGGVPAGSSTIPQIRPRNIDNSG
jgi:hypothetical protein